MTSIVLKFIFVFLILVGDHAAYAGSVTYSQLPPHLNALYEKYPDLHKTLGQYADSQGFTAPQERLSTILHELVHIESAARGGYFVEGSFYAPYNQPNAWPTYRFSQFKEAVTLRAPGLSSADILNTPIFRLYVGNIPNNTLASLADELNAYGQTTKWLCKAVSGKEKASYVDERAKSVQSMRDVLRVTNLFLLTLRSEAPTQYSDLYNKLKVARNLLALTIMNASESLALCGWSILQQDRIELDKLVNISRTEAFSH